LSELVDFEDLGLLDGRDLRAVFNQVPPTQVVQALAGASQGLRQSLLLKLLPAAAAGLEAQLATYGPVPFESVRSAQRAVIDALCRLSRAGQVAFDDPEDMVA
jgi:flagellar motor switch protein FliG